MPNETKSNDEKTLSSKILSVILGLIASFAVWRVVYLVVLLLTQICATVPLLRFIVFYVGEDIHWATLIWPTLLSIAAGEHVYKKISSGDFGFFLEILAYSVLCVAAEIYCGTASYDTLERPVFSAILAVILFMVEKQYRKKHN